MLDVTFFGEEISVNETPLSVYAVNNSVSLESSIRTLFPESSDENLERELGSVLGRAPSIAELSGCKCKFLDVTPRQMRIALVMKGVTITDITNAINSLPEPQKSLANVQWEYSLAFVRTNPLVSQIGAILNWTSEELDNLWVYASTL